MTKNHYFEYKKWSLFWGLFLSQEAEIQKVIRRYNAEGWKVVQFEWNPTKLSVFSWIIILIVTLLTLGFLSYWTGFSIIFEKEE